MDASRHPYSPAVEKRLIKIAEQLITETMSGALAWRELSNSDGDYEDDDDAGVDEVRRYTATSLTALATRPLEVELETGRRVSGRSRGPIVSRLKFEGYGGMTEVLEGANSDVVERLIAVVQAQIEVRRLQALS